MSKFENVDALINRVMEGEDPNAVAGADTQTMDPAVKQEVYEMVKEASEKLEMAKDKMEKVCEADGDMASPDAKEAAEVLAEAADSCQKVMEITAPTDGEKKEQEDPNADPAKTEQVTTHTCKITGLNNPEEFQDKLKALVAEYNGVLVSCEASTTEEEVDPEKGPYADEPIDEPKAEGEDPNAEDPNKDQPTA